MMREICFLSGSDPNCPSQRFRVQQYLERFRQDGIAAGVRSLPRLRPARLLSLLRLRGGRTVVLHRLLLRPWELQLLRRCAGQLVLDFDDALPEVAGATPSRQERLRRRLHATAAAADRIVAGNPCLAVAAANGAARAPGSVLILPTPVDTDRFRPAAPGQRTPGEEPVMVWSGTPGNLPYLEEILPALRALTARCAYRLRVVCSAPFAAEGVPLENRRWSVETEVRDLATADVNLMPLRDSPWTRGKCGYKLLLGMSCGLASVASPVGINREILIDGATGFLASSPEEWIAALATLIRDAALRSRLGQAGRDRVEGEYSLDRAYPRLRDFLFA